MENRTPPATLRVLTWNVGDIVRPQKITNDCKHLQPAPLLPLSTNPLGYWVPDDGDAHERQIHAIQDTMATMMLSPPPAANKHVLFGVVTQAMHDAFVECSEVISAAAQKYVGSYKLDSLLDDTVSRFLGNVHVQQAVRIVASYFPTRPAPTSMFHVDSHYYFDTEMFSRFDDDDPGDPANGKERIISRWTMRWMHRVFRTYRQLRAGALIGATAKHPPCPESDPLAAGAAQTAAQAATQTATDAVAPTSTTPETVWYGDTPSADYRRTCVTQHGGDSGGSGGGGNGSTKRTTARGVISGSLPSDVDAALFPDGVDVTGDVKDAAMLYLLLAFDAAMIHLLNHTSHHWTMARANTVKEWRQKHFLMWHHVQQSGAHVVCLQNVPVSYLSSADPFCSNYWMVHDCKYPPKGPAPAHRTDTCQVVCARKSLFPEPPQHFMGTHIRPKIKNLLVVPLQLPHSGFVQGQPKFLYVASGAQPASCETATVAQAAMTCMIDTAHKIAGAHNPLILGLDTSVDHLHVCEVLHKLSLGTCVSIGDVNTHAAGSCVQPMLKDANLNPQKFNCVRQVRGHVIFSESSMAWCQTQVANRRLKDRHSISNVPVHRFVDAPFPTADFPFPCASVMATLAIKPHAHIIPNDGHDAAVGDVGDVVIDDFDTSPPTPPNGAATATAVLSRVPLQPLDIATCNNGANAGVNGTQRPHAPTAHDGRVAAERSIFSNLEDVDF